jgi:hypothetical protein
MSHDDPENGGPIPVADDFASALDEVPGAKTGWEMLSVQERNAYMQRLDHTSGRLDRSRVIDESMQELTQQLGHPVLR